MQIGHDRLKISNGNLGTKTQWVWMENQLNSSRKLRKIYNIDHSQGDPEGLGKKEQRAGDFKRPDHLYVYVQ